MTKNNNIYMKIDSINTKFMTHFTSLLMTPFSISHLEDLIGNN